MNLRCRQRHQVQYDDKVHINNVLMLTNFALRGVTACLSEANPVIYLECGVVPDWL